MKLNRLNNELFEKIKSRLWWLDILTPLSLATLLLILIFFLLFSGEPHRNIAASIKNNLIEQSLKIAGPRATKTSNSGVIISFKERDKIHFKDKFGSEYYRIALENLINKIKDTDIKEAHISLVPNDIKETAYQLSFSQARFDYGKKFSMTLKDKKELPDTINNTFDITLAWTCLSSVNLSCIFDKTWTEDTLQSFFTKRGKNEVIEDYLTLNLPTVDPSFLLYFNDKEDFREYSFLEVLSDDFNVKELEEKFVFIGNKMKRDVFRISSFFELGVLYTPLDDKSKDPSKNGTFYHEFLAQFNTMLIDEAFIKVAPKEATYSFAVILSLLIFFMLYKFGATRVVILYFFFVISVPFINAFLIRFHQFYFPLFEAILSGASTFLFANFGRLALHAFKQRQNTVTERIHQEAVDIKTNFISLISHNLNTPVAKMQGMLDVLKTVPDEEIKELSIDSLKQTATIQISIKTVLLLTKLEDNGFNREPISIDRILKDFHAEYNPIFKKISKDIDVHLEESDEGFEHLPVNIDKKLTLHFLLAGLYLLTSHDSNRTTQAKIKIDQDDDLRLIITFIGQNDARTFLNLQKINSAELVDPTIQEISFIDAILINFLIHIFLANQTSVEVNLGQDNEDLSFICTFNMVD